MVYTNLLEPYIEHIHVFNWTKTEKYPLIQAKDIWKAYLSAFSGEKTLLPEFMPDNRIETLNTETNAMRNIVGEMKSIFLCKNKNTIKRAYSVETVERLKNIAGFKTRNTYFLPGVYLYLLKKKSTRIFQI